MLPTLLQCVELMLNLCSENYIETTSKRHVEIPSRIKSFHFQPVCQRCFNEIGYTDSTACRADVTGQEYELPLTEYNSTFERWCDNDADDVMVGLWSHYNRTHKDRIWRFTCDKSPFERDNNYTISREQISLIHFIVPESK